MSRAVPRAPLSASPPFFELESHLFCLFAPPPSGIGQRPWRVARAIVNRRLHSFLMRQHWFGWGDYNEQFMFSAQHLMSPALVFAGPLYFNVSGDRFDASSCSETVEGYRRSIGICAGAVLSQNTCNAAAWHDPPLERLLSQLIAHSCSSATRTCLTNDTLLQEHLEGTKLPRVVEQAETKPNVCVPNRPATSWVICCGPCAGESRQCSRRC